MILNPTKEPITARTLQNLAFSKNNAPSENNFENDTKHFEYKWWFVPDCTTDPILDTNTASLPSNEIEQL